MHEVRRDGITGQWVLYSTGRGERPTDFHTGPVQRKAEARYDPACPFCPGNEHLLPSIKYELPALESKPGSKRSPDPAEEGQDLRNPNGLSRPCRERRAGGSQKRILSWQTRVVPNKFSIVTPEVDRNVRSLGPYMVSGGYGFHEVVIESPFHDTDIQGMTESEVGAVVRTYVHRYDELKKIDPGLEVYIFRNHGAGSGTSLVHPHSQIIAIPALSEKRQRLVYEAGQSYRKKGHCVFCEVLRFEKKQKVRILYENEFFLAFIPFAAQVPFEVWIMPKLHKSNFSSIERDEIVSLSNALRSVLKRLYDRLDDPDYNYCIHSFVNEGPESRFLHWYLQILPRFTVPAGFELASGMTVSPSLPEDNCAFLNGSP